MDDSGDQSRLSKCKYQPEISAMMFTFGEVRHSMPETVQLMEDVIKAQILEILIGSAAIARKRGSRHFSFEDIIFLIRRDRIKVARLTAYLGWKKVRRIANRSGAAPTGTTEIDEELVDEGNAAGEAEKKLKRQKIKLSWKMVDQFDDILEIIGSDDEEGTDEDEKEFFVESRARLAKADRITSVMTQEEYMDYAECRQASFTYKKPSRFREWLNVEQHTGMKPNNDILDVLGFLCYEMVRTLTEQALAVKHEMESRLHLTKAHRNVQSEHFVQNPQILDQITNDLREQFKPFSVFASSNERTPIEPVHVAEAFRRLQQNQPLPVEGSLNDTLSVRNNSGTTLRLFSGARMRSKRRLI